jgi:hypothetical protein
MPSEPWCHLNNKALVWLVGTPEAKRVHENLQDKVVYYGPAIELPLIEDGECRLNKSVPYIPPGSYFVVVDPTNNSSLRRELESLQDMPVLTHDGHTWCPKGILFITHHHQMSSSSATLGADVVSDSSGSSGSFGSSGSSGSSAGS